MRIPSYASALIALAVALIYLSAGPADAAIYYRTATSTENGAGSASIVMTVPSGVAAGDLLVSSVNAGGTGAITAPAGWTSIVSGAGTGHYGTLHYRVATAADVAGASYTWTLGSTRKATGGILSYVGVDTTAIGTPSATANTGTTITFNSVTPTAANSLVFLGGSTFNGTSAVGITPPGSTTTRLNFATSSTGSQMRSYSGDFIQPTATATGNKTGTISPSSGWGSAMVAFKPAAGTLAFDVAPAAGTLPSVTLNGQAQTTTSQMSNFAVDDTTGSGSGWNITVAGDGSAGKSAVLKQYCTQAGGCGADPLGYVSGGRTLPAGSLKLSTTGASLTGANGTAPTFQCSSPCSVDAGAATKIASAAAGAGLGPWQTTGFSTSSLSLSTATTLRALPANEIYRADLLWTLSSGP
ncbi:MAG: trimeric autotransporter adhesin [Thermoleophilaceae bacterium]|nr:trimeric autotransporter adhesin [Thermoleophilaceae bacterium]